MKRLFDWPIDITICIRPWEIHLCCCWWCVWEKKEANDGRNKQSWGASHRHAMHDCYLPTWKSRRIIPPQDSFSKAKEREGVCHICMSVYGYVSMLMYQVSKARHRRSSFSFLPEVWADRLTCSDPVCVWGEEQSRGEKKKGDHTRRKKHIGQSERLVIHTSRYPFLFSFLTGWAPRVDREWCKNLVDDGDLPPSSMGKMKEAMWEDRTRFKSNNEGRGWWSSLVHILFTCR